MRQVFSSNVSHDVITLKFVTFTSCFGTQPCVMSPAFCTRLRVEKLNKNKTFFSQFRWLTIVYLIITWRHVTILLKASKFRFKTSFTFSLLLSHLLITNSELIKQRKKASLRKRNFFSQLSPEPLLNKNRNTVSKR